MRVPRENIIAGEGKGLKVALTTLNTGRLTIPAAWSVCANGCSKFRESGPPSGCNGACPSGSVPPPPGKIAEMGGNTFAMEAITFLTSALVDKKAGDLGSKPRCAKCGRPR